MNRRCTRKAAAGFTLLELLVAVAIVIVLASITFQGFTNMVQSANLTRATQKIKDLGQAFVDYTSDHGGRLPLENADIPNISGGDEDWIVAASEEAEEAWYNVLPDRMGYRTVAQLGEPSTRAAIRPTWEGLPTSRVKRNWSVPTLRSG